MSDVDSGCQCDRVPRHASRVLPLGLYQACTVLHSSPMSTGSTQVSRIGFKAPRFDAPHTASYHQYRMRHDGASHEAAEDG